MSFGKPCEFQMGGIALVRYVCRKDAGTMLEKALPAHPGDVLYKLICAQMVFTGDTGSVGMIEDNHIKPRLLPMEAPQVSTGRTAVSVP